MEKTWIKLYRSLLDWCWFKDANTLQVFIWLLLNANIEDHGFQKIIVKRGQIATSYPTICAATGLSTQSVRTAISHLKSTGELTGKQYPQFSLFTIEKYEQYQDVPTGISTVNQQSTNRQLTGNQQATNTNIRKKERKNERKEEYIYTAVAVFSEDAELQNLILDFYDSRKKMKKPMTDKAVDMFLNKLRPYPVSEQKQMIENAIVNGWQSVYPVEKQKQKQQQKQSSVYNADASYGDVTAAFMAKAIGMEE